MTTTQMLLSISGTAAFVLATVPSASLDVQPALVGNLTGSLRIQQAIPCVDDVDQTTPVSAGRLELVPAEGVTVMGGKRYTLTNVNVFFAPFSISRSCAGVAGDTRSYTEVGVQLARAVSFTATPAGAGLYNVTIPKEDFLFREAAIVNGSPESGYKLPSEDVTGTLDLDGGTMQMRVVVATRIRFKFGCSFLGCLYDSTEDGLLTANIAGTIAYPDADSDGVPDRDDNCRFVPNPTQSLVSTPTNIPPADITLASCADHSIGWPTALDRCDAGPVTVTNDAPGTFAVGANVVTWRAEDAIGRVATSTQTVTVVDTTKPSFTFVPLDITVNDCGPVDLGTAAATDDCAGTPAIANDAPASFGVGATPVTWTATDASGNQQTTTQTVTVVDTVAPTVSCTPAGPPGLAFQAIATDACTSSPVLRLGTFVLENGETIKIEETGQAGVRLVNVVGRDRIKHFQVGKGEAVITGTDGSGNVGSAICRW